MRPKLEWRAAARDDLVAIVSYIADDDPDAAQALKDEIEIKTNELPAHPKLYKPGRIKGTRENGTREVVIRPNYVVVYQETATRVAILRVLHTARQWP